SPQHHGQSAEYRPRTYLGWVLPAIGVRPPCIRQRVRPMHGGMGQYRPLRGPRRAAPQWRGYFPTGVRDGSPPPWGIAPQRTRSGGSMSFPVIVGLALGGPKGVSVTHGVSLSPGPRGPVPPARGEAPLPLPVPVSHD